MNQPAMTPNAPVTLAEIREAFSRNDPVESAYSKREKKSAVAMILAGAEQDPEVCLIRRAESKSDRWSGHMAFPGGRVEPEDANLHATAERETMEEVGVRLNDSHFLAPLTEIPVFSGGRDVGMVLFPFVYYLGPAKATLAPNQEVAQAFWTPLSYLLDAQNGGELTIERQGKTVRVPTVRFGEHHLWGLTYRIFSQFAELISRPMPQVLHQP